VSGASPWTARDSSPPFPPRLAEESCPFRESPSASFGPEGGDESHAVQGTRNRGFLRNSGSNTLQNAGKSCRERSAPITPWGNGAGTFPRPLRRREMVPGTFPRPLRRREMVLGTFPRPLRRREMVPATLPRPLRCGGMVPGRSRADSAAGKWLRGRSRADSADVSTHRR